PVPLGGAGFRGSAGASPSHTSNSFPCAMVGLSDRALLGERRHGRTSRPWHRGKSVLGGVFGPEGGDEGVAEDLGEVEEDAGEGGGGGGEVEVGKNADGGGESFLAGEERDGLASVGAVAGEAGEDEGGDEQKQVDRQGAGDEQQEGDCAAAHDGA